MKNISNEVRKALLLLPLLTALVLAGCGGGGSSSSGSNNLVPGASDDVSDHPDNPDNSDDPGAEPELPQAPELSLEIQATKSFQFNWQSVDGAETYRLLENPDGMSGFSEVVSLPATESSYQHIVFLPQRVNASYILEACNDAGCEDSPSVPVTGHLAEAVGYIKASNTDVSDWFGSSIALSGDGLTLAVGAKGEDSASTVINEGEDNNEGRSTGAVYLFVLDENAGEKHWHQEAYIKSSSDSSQSFGNTVALSGDGTTLAVGGVYPFGVYIYSLADGAWSEHAFLEPQSGVTASNIGFGHSLALSLDGDTLAIGAPTQGVPPDEGSTHGSGAAYIFVHDGTDWSEQAFLTPGLNANANDRFGDAIALSGDGNVLAVGAPLEDSNAVGVSSGTHTGWATDSGAVYTFVRNGQDWTRHNYIKASNTDAEDKFGTSVALADDGLTLAVGAPRESSRATDINGDETDNDGSDYAGAVYVFSRTDAEESFEQQAYIKPDTTGFAYFGQAVALSSDGHSLVVGAYTKPGGSAGINNPTGRVDNSGAAYLFTRQSELWQQTAFIKASNPKAGMSFGENVALASDGETLAVSASNENSSATGINGDQDDDSAFMSGAVYLY
ncbi:hypothetical protein ACXYTJ_08170 [Gilvimarinus sp. F26214L]|uniref:hypothetical protein n=1 Tax=Gilvimarinus sp. DZF01 TaxID=3461371 RepID=UPI0040454B4B